MKTLEKVSDFVGKYMAAIVIVVAALSLLFPRHLQCGKDRMGQHPAGHRHVRHGSYPKPEDLRWCSAARKT